MKERIQEALRRRHRKEDEGFTLIELLVVILIIAILAAVAIVALLAALNAGRKSSATTVANNAATSVRSVQTSLSQTDFVGINEGKMDIEDPDLEWFTDSVSATGNNVAITQTGSDIILATKSDKNICYFVKLQANPTGNEAGTMYGSAAAGAGGACATSAIPAAGTTDGSLNATRKIGFAL